MSPSNWARSLDGRTLLVIVALAVLVLTAGCLGLGDSGGDDPEMNDNGTQNGENGENGESEPADPTLPGSASDWLAQFDIESADENRSVDDFVADTTAEIEAATGYEYSRTTEVEDLSQTETALTTTEQEIAINVTSQTVSYTRTVSNQRSESTSEGYLQNGTVYERTGQAGNLSGAQWVQQDLGGDYENLYRQFDVIDGFLNGLDNGSVRIEGTADVDGTETTVLRVDLDTQLEGSANSTQVEESLLLLWVADSSNELLRASSYSRFSGTEGDAERRITNDYQFEMGAVDITVPEDATEDSSDGD